MEDIELGNIESTGVASEGKEASQEDIVRVSEQIKKANKYSGQVKSTTIKNNKYAKFLQYLIINITDDEFWKLADIFDIESDHKIPFGDNNQTFLVHLFCGFMVAVFTAQADEYNLQEIYGQIDYHIPKTFLDYLSYVQSFGKTDDNIWRLDKEGVSKFVKYILVHFGFEDNQKLSEIGSTNTITAQNNTIDQPT